MKKLIKTVLFLAVTVVLLVYFGGSVVLGNATRRALPRVQELLRSEGIEVTGLEFADARITSHRSVRWSDIAAVERPLGDASSPGGQLFDVWINEVAFELEDLSLKRHKLIVSGLTARPEGALSSEYDRASSRFKEAAVLGRVEVALASAASR